VVEYINKRKEEDMNYFQNLWGAFTGNPTVVLAEESGRIAELVRSAAGPNAYTPSKADQIATVYTCIKILSDSISQMPLNTVSDGPSGSKLKDKTSPLYPLLHYAPNPWTSSHKFFGTLEYHRNLHGNAFARIVRDPAGRPIRFEIIPPSTFKRTKQYRGNLYYVFIDPLKKSGEEVVNSDNILHFYNITKDGVVGITPITALRLNLSSTFNGLESIDKIYRNDLKKVKALKWSQYMPNKKAQKEAVNTLQSDLNEPGFGGGKIVTLPDGADLIDLQLTPQDMEFVNTISLNKKDIAAAFRVPPHMVGILEASKFNNVEMMIQEFLSQGLGAILKMYRSELEMKLLSVEERIAGRSIEFNTNALLQLDFKTRVQGYKDLILSGVMTPNAAAIYENLPTYPQGDKHWIPSNMMFSEDRLPKSENPEA
jgi:HK97 family phage portal protein